MRDCVKFAPCCSSDTLNPDCVDTKTVLEASYCGSRVREYAAAVPTPRSVAITMISQFLRRMRM